MVAPMIKTGFLVLALYLIIPANARIFLDDSFPYRIVCAPEWVETHKSDSTLILDKVSAGTKTRFQLKKYRIDSTFNRDTRDWSRLNFAINKELAVQFGKLVFVDTSATKKLGDYRAFEMFAFFSESTSTQKVWWADYCRWTDHDGYGFLVSIIGDTISMKQNYTAYKTLFDSISISRINTEIICDRDEVVLPVFRASTPRSLPRHDLLGRSFPATTTTATRLSIGKKIRQCRIR
jgi:hypothetical protein